MTVEKKLEQKLVKMIKEKGGIAIKIYSVFFTGLPDRLVLMPRGHVSWVELKSAGRKQTPRQQYVSKLLRKLGFTVWVIDSQQLLDDYYVYLAKSQRPYEVTVNLKNIDLGKAFEDMKNQPTDGI